jgi:hypothetical protein
MDIFNNTTSLAIIAILLLVIGLCFLFVYIEYVKRDQNHKIASMLSLVSSITEEVQSIRNFMSVITSGQVSHISVSNGGVPQSQELNDYEEENNVQRRNAYHDTQSEKDELIEVSDDEEESENEDEEEDEDEEENDEEDEENESINDSETDDDNEEDCDNNEDESDEENEEYNDSEIEELEDEDVENKDELDDDYEPTEESVFKLNNDSNELESLVVEDEVVANVVSVVDVISVVDVSEEVEEKEVEPAVITQDQKDLFKTISITSLEDDGIRIVESQDFKKMSLPKLKQVVVEKKLVADSSKLKKHDILKLLGVEA